MRGLMMDFPLTLVHILERAGKIFGDVEIVSRRPDRRISRYTYREFYRRARKLARALELAGMKPGDRVATLLWNHSSNLECYFGIPAAGGVMHTLNLRLHSEEIAYIANHARDRFLIFDEVLLPLYESIRSTKSPSRTAPSVFFFRMSSAPFPMECRKLCKHFSRKPIDKFRLSRNRRESGCFHVFHLRHHRQAEGRGLFASRPGAAQPRGLSLGQFCGQQQRYHPACLVHVPRKRLGRAVRSGHDGRETRVSQARISTPKACSS